MTALAPTLEAFFTERLICQRQASPNTVAAYRDGWRLLLRFAAGRTGKQPSELDVADLDAALIGAFLEHLETERHNSVRTRNARLAAIRSFFRFAAEAAMMTSNWGTRNELEEVLALARSGRLVSAIERHPLSEINEVFERLATGQIPGRAVLVPGAPSSKG